MIVVIQRVSGANVRVDNNSVGAIDKGLMVLLGIETEDHETDADWLVKKLLALRIFDDSQGMMNLSVKDVNGELLVVSQFTLHGSTRKGNRPSYIRAAKPEKAIPLYRYFLKECELGLGKTVASGTFGADMKVELVNDGPVTIIMDSKNPQ